MSKKKFNEWIQFMKMVSTYRLTYLNHLKPFFQDKLQKAKTSSLSSEQINEWYDEIRKENNILDYIKNKGNYTEERWLIESKAYSFLINQETFGLADLMWIRKSLEV